MLHFLPVLAGSVQQLSAISLQKNKAEISWVTGGKITPVWNFNNKYEENGFTSSMLRFNVKTENKHIHVKVLYVLYVWRYYTCKVLYVWRYYTFYMCEGIIRVRYYTFYTCESIIRVRYYTCKVLYMWRYYTFYMCEGIIRVKVLYVWRYYTCEGIIRVKVLYV